MVQSDNLPAIPDSSALSALANFHVARNLANPYFARISYIVMSDRVVGKRQQPAQLVAGSSLDMLRQLHGSAQEKATK
eukprot:scaffold175806_cov22-Prasinocladus_malaysianus.AAC.1